MTVHDNRMGYLLRIGMAWIILSLMGITTGCGTTSIEIDYSTPLKKSDDKYTLVHNKHYPDARFIEFIDDKVVVGGIGQVDVVDLKLSKTRRIAFTEHGMVINVQPSKNKKRLLVAINGESIEIFDTRSWKVLRRFKGGINKFRNGLSPDGKVVYFGDALWSVDSGKKIKDAPADQRVSVHAFTPDSRYFIEGGYHRGFQIVDLKTKQILPGKTKVEEISKIISRNTNEFYAGYDPIRGMDDGGYYAGNIGLFDILTNDKIKSVSFGHNASCWNTMPDDSLFVVLGNGDVILLDKQLNPTAKWHVPGLLRGNVNTRLCAAGPDHSIWLAKIRSGIYRINTKQRTLSNPDTTKELYDALAVSEDGKYMGFSKRKKEGGNVVRVYRVR